MSDGTRDPQTEPQDQNPVLVELIDIKKDYIVDKQPFPAIKGISLCLPRRGFVAVLGESGSGKTTLLNIIGGLDHYSSGDLRIDGESTKDFKSKDWDAYRNTRCGFVFQSYQLLARENVLHNVTLPLQFAGVGAKEAKERAKDLLKKVGLSDYIKKKPNQLSGGQQQRVAIARALGNNPDIVLADEPTGALDSETSIQIMDLLKEVSKNRLVVMVTHNKELADRYAERIIKMKDGLVVADSAKLDVPAVSSAKAQPKKRSTMSFGAAASASLRSLRSKFWRAFSNAFVISMGVIGVGLVLSVTMGFSSYVKTIETSLVSTVPLSLSPTVYATNSSAKSDTSEPTYPSDNQVHIYNSSSTSYVAHQNRFTQEYLDYVSAIMDDPECTAYGKAMSVMINRTSYDYHFVTKDGLDGEHYRKLDQYSFAGTTASSMSSYSSLPTTVLHEIYGDEEKLDSLYDVIYGRFPTKENEMVLIVDRYNRINFDCLKRLGIINSNKQYADMVASDTKTIDFSAIVADSPEDTDCAVYKCYLPSDYYQVATSNPIEFSCECYAGVHYDVGEEKFVGTASTKKCKSYVGANKAGVDYPYDAVYENTDGNLHPIECRVVGVIRPSQQSFLQLMPASIGYTRALSQKMAEDTAEGGAGYDLALAQGENWYVPRVLKDDGTPSASDGLEILNTVTLPIIRELTSKTAEEAKALLTSSYLTNAVNGSISYLNAGATHNVSTGKYVTSVTTGVSAFLSWCHNYGTTIDTEQVPPIKMSDDCLSDWLDVLLSEKLFSSDGEPSMVQCLSYLNGYSSVTGILIYPSTISAKADLTTYLDAWNVGKSDADSVIYVDAMENITGSLSALISMISVVLVAFALIAVAVSSIMTGITTRMSVVERTREIGLLRACGGRKFDVTRLFETENGLIGLAAGLFGVAMTYVLCIPINWFIRHRFSSYAFSDIAVCYPWIAVVVLVLAIALALLSGFLPALRAAKKDPVVCLRSE